MELLHRLPKALLVAIIAALLGGGAIGFAVADDQEGVPVRFGVEAARGGDQWEYDVIASFHAKGEAFGEPIDEGESFDATLAYQWQEARVWQDHEGQSHAVRHLHEEFREESTVEVIGHLVEMQNWNTVAYFATGVHPFSFNLPGLIPVVSEDSQTQGTTSYTDIYYGRNIIDPFCGFHNELQGNDLLLADGVSFSGECVPADIQAELPFETTSDFFPTLTEQVGGMQTVRFDNDFQYGTIAMWMTRHVPYPVKVLAEADFDLRDIWPDDEEPLPRDIDLTVSISFELRMTGFDAGTEPLTPDMELPPRVYVPQVQLAARQVWGPDEVGVTHPFSLRQAFTTAYEYNDFQEFVDDDAVVTAADSWVFYEEGRTEHRWEIQIDDGDDIMTVRVSRVESDEQPTDAITDTIEPRITYEYEELSVNIDDPVDPDDLPDQLPTVASMMRRWDIGHAEPANHWSLRLACDFNCNQHVAVGTNVVQGDAPEATDELTGAQRTTTSTLEAIAADAQGNMLFERQQITESSTTSRGVVPLSDSEPEGQAPADPAPVETVAAGVWTTPNAQTATGVGLAASLIGLIYWLWPALKTAPLSLFSRVHGEQLLEHPVRGDMMQIIQDRPGIHYQALVRELGKGRGVVEHHMRKLQQSGFVVAHKTDGVSCFFPKGAVDRHIMATMPALKSPTAQDILRAIVAQPGTTAGAIAQQLGIAPSTISHHLRRLEGVGLIDRTRNGQQTQVLPTSLAQRSLSLTAA